MKTHTSKHIIWVRSLVLLPLLAILIYSFSTNKVVEKTMTTNSSEISHTARSIDVEVFDNETYKIDGIKATKATFASVLNQQHQDISHEVRNQIINVHVNNGKPVSDEDVWFIYNTFIKYGFHRIVTYNQEIIREKGNKPFAITKNNEQQRKNPTLEITEEPLKLTLNGKQTSLENLKNDFNKITGGQKSDLLIDSKGVNIKIELLQKIFKEIEGNLNKATLSDGVIHDTSKTKLIKKDNGTFSFKSIEETANTSLIKQTNPLPKIYGRVCDGCEVNLTIESLKNLTIETNTKEPIASFKIKFVSKPTVSVTGNKLNAAAIKHLNNSKNGDYIQLFNLKTPTTRIKPPVIIKLIDKSEVLPPPPPPSSIKNDENKNLSSYKLKDKNGKNINVNVSYQKDSSEDQALEKQAPPPPPPPIPANATPEQKEKYQKISEEYYKKYKVENGKVSAREPLPPKPPKSPLDHVIEMAKKNATFYLEGKEISSDKAIEILKANKSMNISTKNSSTKNPKVYLSKQPITIKKK